MNQQFYNFRTITKLASQGMQINASTMIDLNYQALKFAALSGQAEDVERLLCTFDNSDRKAALLRDDLMVFELALLRDHAGVIANLLSSLSQQSALDVISHENFRIVGSAASHGASRSLEQFLLVQKQARLDLAC